MSVVEVLVALMLVAIGMLGIAASSTIALRTTLDASRRRVALHGASRRVAVLQATACHGPTAGTAMNDGHREWWTVGAKQGGFAMITDSLEWTSRSGKTVVVLSTAAPC